MRGVAEPAFYDSIDADIGLETFDGSDSFTVGLWPDGGIAFINGALHDNLRRLGGDDMLRTWGLGANYLTAMTEGIRSFYRQLFDKALTEGQVVRHEYLCPTPRLQQRVALRVQPLGGSKALLLVHAKLWESPHGEPEQPRDAVFRDGNGILVQCSNCRHVKRQDQIQSWDLVREYIESPQPNTSHGLCPSCAVEYYNTHDL